MYLSSQSGIINIQWQWISVNYKIPDPLQCAWKHKRFGLKALTSVRKNLSCGFGIFDLPLYELYWLLTTRHLTANTFSCIPIFLDNDFCKTINLFIIDIYACSIYLEEKVPIKNKQTSINKNHHVNVESVFSPSVLDFPSVIWLVVGSHTDLKCCQAHFFWGCCAPKKCQMTG